MNASPDSDSQDPDKQDPRDGGGRTHFGFREVAEEEKAPLVKGLFRSVAGNYDLMNDLMSGGIHRLWKSTMIDWLDPRPGIRLLDTAGGTGDIAFKVRERLDNHAAQATAESNILVCDLTLEMIEVGRDRALDHGIFKGIDWICGDAQQLPLPDSSVTAYTIAFGLRNVTHIDQALREARRVLKPGGRFLCLEFSHVVAPLFAALYDRYSFNVLPAMGAAIAGDRDSYVYLAESIRRFPPQDELASKMTEAGLEKVRYRNLSGGIAAIHSGWRI
ncbi:class I SAM-dependent methyltransferase [Pelagibius litoralis]|uniref:Ubiquinone/menaquinone biosynthesis C-methyltransferase UbiE n=1 Tax=Pelagibius litoralis TaxID=374515 RepID=A0A967EX77_9PROT|nr:class I SAM-dependent methyltransferase [Pelagibius litoralis]NIA68120.1 class I SAM-dependent methyltransferase [Pelagibius litoralis]